jgi:UDP-N-acetylglucosamine 4-epimerase
MQSSYQILQAQLRQTPRRWLVTGAAGFIGSNLVQTLLQLDQDVVGLDDFSTGYERNLEETRQAVTPAQWARLRMIRGDIRDAQACAQACAGVEHVLHQAALGSVPRSVANPLLSHEVNTTGFLNMLIAARDAGVKRFVYAASSSTYGDHPALPKVEDRIGRPLSPYAVTKFVNELYADVFARNYGISCAGLRYFNVFGPRQDPHGAYAAVIPLWIKAMLCREDIFINGDGLTSRDFCHVNNAVQANLLAACTDAPGRSEVYNVAVGDRTTLLELFDIIRTGLEKAGRDVAGLAPVLREFRAGDVRHSQADIGKAAAGLGYQPTHDVRAGLAESLAWYVEHLGTPNAQAHSPLA